MPYVQRQHIGIKIRRLILASRTVGYTPYRDRTHPQCLRANICCAGSPPLIGNRIPERWRNARGPQEQKTVLIRSMPEALPRLRIRRMPPMRHVCVNTYTSSMEARQRKQRLYPHSIHFADPDYSDAYVIPRRSMRGASRFSRERFRRRRPVFILGVAYVPARRIPLNRRRLRHTTRPPGRKT